MLGTSEERLQMRRDSETSVTTMVSSTSSSSAINGQRDSQRILDHVNLLLADNYKVAGWLPLTLTGEDEHAFYNAVKNGILLSELISHLVPTAIKTEKLHTDFSNPNKKLFFMLENQGKVLAAAQKIGCRLVNLSASDMVEGRGYLVLSVIWQILKNGMITRVLNAAPAKTAVSTDCVPLGEAEVPSDDPIFDTSVDEADLALIRLISAAIRPISSNVRRVALLLEDTELMCEIFQQAGAQQELIEDFENIEEPMERAKAIVKIGKVLLGDHSLIEIKDILNGNSEMIIIFLATLLENILQKRNQKDVAEDIETREVEEAEGVALLKGQIELYKEEINRLVDENDSLGDKIIGLQTEMEALKAIPVAQSDSASVMSFDVGDSSPLADNIFRAQRPKNPSLDKNSQRLRQIYQNTTNLEPICRGIYGDLSLQALQMGSSKCGPLKKKDRNSMKWRHRFLILRDNFLFVFKDTAKPRDYPVDILRIDDALVRVMFEVQNMDEPVISVEIASKINPFYVYFSGPASELNLWKDNIIQNSAWWIME